MKYKVWSFVERKWKDDVFIFPDGKLNCSYLISDNKKDFAICPYTGFKDKNDKLIYCGDIIKYNDEEIGIIRYCKFNRTIMLDDFSIEYYEEKDEHEYSYTDSNYIPEILDDEKTEIIGNIYENKEIISKINLSFYELAEYLEGQVD